MLLTAWVCWKPEVGVGDIITTLSVIVTAVGVWFAYDQLRRGVRQEHAQFLMGLTERYFADNDVRKFYYELENGKFVFEPATFAGSEQERWLDHLIYTFDVIGWAVKTNSLTPSEAEIFAFQASQVLKNDEVVKYLAWLDDEYARQGRPVPAHKDAKDLVETLNNCGQSQPKEQTPPKSGGRRSS